MALYLVSYDITENDAWEYESVWATLRSLNAVKILYSEWLIVSRRGSTESIYNSIVIVLQSKDRLLVQEVLADAYWNNLLISDQAFRALLKNARM